MLEAYRELIDLLAETPTRLKDAAATAGEPPAGEWNAAQVIGHLSITEHFFLERINLIVHENEPRLRNFQKPAAERFEALRDNDAETNLKAFNALRGETVSTLMSLALGSWERTGMHDTRGEISVEDVVEAMIDHDSEHLDQINAAG